MSFNISSVRFKAASLINEVLLAFLVLMIAGDHKPGSGRKTVKAQTWAMKKHVHGCPNISG